MLTVMCILSLFLSLSLSLSLTLSMYILAHHAHTLFQHTPAIGHIVILATFAGIPWAELATPYLSEGFDRQVRRIVDEHCDLNTSEPNAKIDATRISKSFQSINLSGLRFIMTQLAFNRSGLI